MVKLMAIATCSRWICMISEQGNLLCLCFRAMFRQAVQSVSFFFLCDVLYATCMQEEEHRTTKMEKGQKDNSAARTHEDIRAQQLVAVHMETLDKNISVTCAH